jgi:diketogulonate reductase-like aldo/keto reductase
VNAVLWALELGYRQIYITTKFNPGRQDPAKELEQSLKRLDVDFVDLYLVYWPQGGATRAWPGMERAHQLGHARSIGVSNFNVDELREVIASATAAPVVNQVRLSPMHHRRALVAAGRQLDVAFEAYSPLGTGRHLGNETLLRIAERVGRSPAQVLLRWSIQHDFIVLPKSTHRDRIEQNAAIFDFVLADSDMAELDGLDKTGGTDRALERPWW